MKNKVITGSCVLMIIMLLFLVIIRVSRKIDTVKITTIKNAYSFVSKEKEDEYISIPIFINSKNNYYINKEKIESSSLVDDNEENLVKLDLQETVLLKEYLKIDDEKFYLYNFKFKIVEENSLQLRKVYLKIDYISEIVKIDIGSFSYYKVPFYGENDEIISLTNLKAIVNDYENSKSVVGVIVGIKNNSKKNIELTNVLPLEINYCPSMSEIVEVDKIPESNEKIDNILGYKYDYINLNENISNYINIESGAVKYFLVPIKKIGNYVSSDFGIEINFIYEGEMRKMYIDDFLYFSNSTNIKYKDLEVLTYENH